MGRPSRRGELLDKGVDVLHQRGYAAATVEGITELVGVPKGAFFNHFGSKEAFAVEALQRYFERWQEKISTISADTELDAIEKLRALIAATTDGARESSYSFGCLIGNLSAELSGEHESIRFALSDIFQHWAREFESIIEAGQKAGEVTTSIRPQEAARFLVNGLQGALLRCKVDRNSTALADFDTIVFDLLLLPRQQVGSKLERGRTRYQRKRKSSSAR